MADYDRADLFTPLAGNAGLDGAVANSAPSTLTCKSQTMNTNLILLLVITATAFFGL